MRPFRLPLLLLLCLLPEFSFLSPFPTAVRRTTSVARRTSNKPSGPPLPSAPLGVVWPAKADTGHGAVVVDLFLDLCCPFSKRLLHTVAGGVAASYEGKVTFIFHPVAQPWHGQSSFMHEAALAVLKIEGAEAFWRYAVEVCRRQEEFFDDQTFEKSRLQIYKELVIIANEMGFDSTKIMARLQLAGSGNSGNAVTQRMKWVTKFHRTRGVHVTPTVFVNGLEARIVSSDWKAEDWATFLDWHLSNTPAPTG